MSQARPRVAVVHPVPVWHGGAEVVALWTIQALKKDFEVTVLSYGAPADFEHLNRCFGTSIAPAEVSWSTIPIPSLAFRFRGPFDILWRYVTMYHCRRLARRFDLFVSTFYEMDFGRPGVQYCHCPMYATSGVAGPQAPRSSALRRAAWSTYGRATAALTGFRRDRMLRNVTLANSEWTGRRLGQAYGRPIRTLYPPVQGSERPLPWAERADGFVCIGRLVPEKRFDAMIRVIEGVRQRGQDVHLHLVTSAPDPEYERVVRALVETRADWITVHCDLSRDAVLELVAAHKYGIHAREDEHFGLAPAEMAASGAIVFVHDSGGQVEIAPDRRIRYSDERDAVSKIVAVMLDEAVQAELRLLLAERASVFSTSHFMAELRAIVLGCLGDGARSAT